MNDNEPPNKTQHVFNKSNLAYGPCKTYIPDNAKSLFGPALAPALTELGFEIALPPVAMPTGKAAIERFFGTLKGMLRQTPLPVVDMIRAEELEYNVGDFAITMSQLRDLINQSIVIHNDAPGPGPGHRTPNQQLEQHFANNPTLKYTDLNRVERAIGTTDQAILDRNGVIYDGLRYRDKVKVNKMLLNMKHLGPHRVTKRKDNTIGIAVKIRRNPGNLSFFQVFDDVAKEWVMLTSTELEYTYLLSAGEHKLFVKRAKERSEFIKNREARLASVAATRAEMDTLVPGLKFQQRRKYAALCESKEVQRHSGRPYPNTDDEQSLSIDLDRPFREDAGLPGDGVYSLEKARKNAGDYFAGKHDEETSTYDDDDEGLNFDDVPELSDKDFDL